jgi:hypothetical protein
MRSSAVLATLNALANGCIRCAPLSQGGRTYEKRPLLLSAVAMALLMACGVALAATLNPVSCQAGVVCNGTNISDKITVTSRADTINARDGNDTLSALGGADKISGDAGTDRLDGARQTCYNYYDQRELDVLLGPKVPQVGHAPPLESGLRARSVSWRGTRTRTQGACSCVPSRY